MDNTKELTGFRKYCAEQNISFTAQRIFIDGLGGMASSPRSSSAPSSTPWAYTSLT